jgi:sec-independent protein translocase protein TatB
VFNLSGSEIIVILLLALVILGPEKLPEAMRKAGRAYSELRRMANGFQSEVRSALDEPMSELKGTADAIRDATTFSGDDKKKPAPAKPAGPRPAAGAGAVTPATDPDDEPHAAGSEPDFADLEPDFETDPSDSIDAMLEGEDDDDADEDVVTRTLSGDVGPPRSSSTGPEG